MTDRDRAAIVDVAGSLWTSLVAGTGLVEGNHALIEWDGRAAAEPGAPEAGLRRVLEHAPSAEDDDWIVLFERVGRLAESDLDPRAGSTETVEVDPPSAGAFGSPNGIAEAPDDPARLWEIIAAWRAADRELALLAEDDPDWNRVHAEVVGLRALHHRRFDARLDQERVRSEALVTRIAAAAAAVAREWCQARAPQPVTA